MQGRLRRDVLFRGVAAKLLVLLQCPAQGALVMPLMAQGFQMGLIKFNVITARKQSSS